MSQLNAVASYYQVRLTSYYLVMSIISAGMWCFLAWWLWYCLFITCLHYNYKHCRLEGPIRNSFIVMAGQKSFLAFSTVRISLDLSSVHCTFSVSGQRIITATQRHCRPTSTMVSMPPLVHQAMKNTAWTASEQNNSVLFLRGHLDVHRQRQDGGWGRGESEQWAVLWHCCTYTAIHTQN